MVFEEQKGFLHSKAEFSQAVVHQGLEVEGQEATVEDVLLKDEGEIEELENGFGSKIFERIGESMDVCVFQHLVVTGFVDIIFIDDASIIGIDMGVEVKAGFVRTIFVDHFNDGYDLVKGLLFFVKL